MDLQFDGKPVWDTDDRGDRSYVRRAAWGWVVLGCLLVGCAGQGTASTATGGPSGSQVPSVIDEINRSTPTTVASRGLVDATVLAPISDGNPPAGDATPDTINPDLVPFWYFDLGVIGAPGLHVGDREYYNTVTLGNSADTPIRLESVTFPELPDGLVVTRVVLYREDQPELASGEDPFPADASPVEGFVLEPTGGVVENLWEDSRFVSVYVEVEVVAEGEWIIGPMDVTYEVGGVEVTRRVSETVGSACTTPVDVPCIPHLQS